MAKTLRRRTRCFRPPSQRGQIPGPGLLRDELLPSLGEIVLTVPPGHRRRRRGCRSGGGFQGVRHCAAAAAHVLAEEASAAAASSEPLRQRRWPRSRACARSLASTSWRMPLARASKSAGVRSAVFSFILAVPAPRPASPPNTCAPSLLRCSTGCPTKTRQCTPPYGTLSSAALARE